MDEETRMARAKTWVLRTIDDLAKKRGLQITVAWGADKYTKHKEILSKHLQYVVVLTWDSGSDDHLCFEKRELDDYPGNNEKLRERIRQYLEVLPGPERREVMKVVGGKCPYPGCDGKQFRVKERPDKTYDGHCIVCGGVVSGFFVFQADEAH